MIYKLLAHLYNIWYITRPVKPEARPYVPEPERINLAPGARHFTAVPDDYNACEHIGVTVEVTGRTVKPARRMGYNRMFRRVRRELG